MQTFLPFADFKKSAEMLDYRRLGKQRVETYQILKSLEHGGGWINHPAVQMWKGYEGKLIEYGLIMCVEWVRRGYVDNMTAKLVTAYRKDKHRFDKPWWLGDERLHSSHRAALLHKAPEFYGKYEWSEEPKIDYWWPTKSEKAEQLPPQIVFV